MAGRLLLACWISDDEDEDDGGGGDDDDRLRGSRLQDPGELAEESKCKKVAVV